jgi:hypothetical protein
MNKVKISLLVAMLLGMLQITLATAQTNQINLKLRRDNGYGGPNNDIQGLFSMRVTGPSDLNLVEFYIDENKIGQVNQPPYYLQFKTDDYPLGLHELSAIGISSGGQLYHSNIIDVNFVSKQAAWKTIFPVFGIVLLVILISIGISILGGGRKKIDVPLGAERNYGSVGGGICPNCHRPFALPLLSLNLGISKLTRCPYCGKVGLVRRASIAKLRQAEKAELDSQNLNESSSNFPNETDDERLRREIDDSKFQDL